MNLHELGMKYNTDKSYEHNFCSIYERELPKDIKTLIEIGIDKGASLNMWAEYYKDAKIIGFDILDKSSLSYLPNIETKLLDQSNLEQLKTVANNYKDIDIIVDDGSHRYEHQIKTFEALFNSLKSLGYYIIEDLHTSTKFFPGNGNSDKTTLMYLNDIISGNEPLGYEGQFQTNLVLNNIKSVFLFANENKQNHRSITSIIQHK